MGNQSTKQHQISGGKPKKYVHWKSAERPSAPGRPILIPLSDQQPDVITLKWDRSRTDGGSAILGYIVEHRRTGSPHWVRATPTLVLRNEASISGLEPGWRYQFRVFAENVVGKSEPSELSDPLTVTLQRNAITVPRFVTELKDTIVVENDRVEMHVSVLGQPPPEINWFKDGFEIFSSRRTKILNENDSSVLVIHQVALTDEGEIKCTATNRAGHVVTRANLKIEAPPKIRLPRQYEEGIIVEAEEVLRLKVGIAGQPAPTLIWSHEGQVMHNGGRFEIITTDKNSSLKILNIKRADRGEYTLRAINKLGEDVASFLVTVTARPTPPGQIKLTMSFGRSATLIWTAPLDDGGCKIGNYIVEYFRIGWNVWLKAATTRKLTATLHDLIEGSEYKFRVKAENPYGLSDPSEESDTLFIPDPKRGISQPEKRDKKSESGKPVPPRRKNLSPLRNLLNRKSPNRDVSPPHGNASPSRNVQLLPEIYGNEDLKREMCYGTPNEVLDPKELKRKESLKMDEANRRRTPSPRSGSDKKAEKSPKLQRNEELQITPNLERRGSGMLEISQKVQQLFKRSPSPARRNEKPEEEVEIRKNSLNLERIDEKSPKLQRNEELQITPNLERRGSGMLEISQKVQQLFKRSPSPARRNEIHEEEVERRKTSPNLEKIDDISKLEINQKQQGLFRRSPSPARREESRPEKVVETTTNNKSIQKREDNKRISPKKIDDSIPKMDSNRKVQQLFRRSPSPARSTQNINENFDDKNSPNPERKEELMRLDINQKVQSFFRRASSPEPIEHINYDSSLIRSESLRRSQEPVKDDKNASLPARRDMRATSPNPTIRISAPTSDLDKSLGGVLKTPTKVDEVHTSNEFMLVLYPTEKSKEQEKRESFDLELEEALSPPTFSLSVPELGCDQQYLLPHQLKKSYSSTELLYERAMARFYDAIEMEKAEKVRKRKLSQDQEPIRKRLSSIGESERLSFEKRSSLRRRLSGEIPQNIASAIPSKWDSKEYLSMFKNENTNKRNQSLHHQQSSYDDDDILNDEEDKNHLRQGSVEYEEDYSESTASSEDSIEKFKIELAARTRSVSDELETYHPRRMDLGTFSPYRTPTPDQSSIVLSKPLPLPNPDFIPKPILKRSSSESVSKEENNNENIKEKHGSQKSENKGNCSKTDSFEENIKDKPEPQKPESKSKGFKAFFRRDKTSSDQGPSKNGNNSKSRKTDENRKFNGNQNGNNNINNKVIDTTNIVNQVNPRQVKTEETRQKQLERRRSSEEEAKVVINYYSDIVRELGSSRKSSVPIYMNSEELKRAAERAAEEEEKRLRPDYKFDEIHASEEELLMQQAAKMKHRLSIVERLQVSHVQTKSKLALEKPLEKNEVDQNKKAQFDNENKPTTIEETSSVRGRTGAVPKKLKKRTPSGPRSRDASTVITDPMKSNPVGQPKRTTSRTRKPSKSPNVLNRRVIKNNEVLDIRLPIYTPSEPPRPITPDDFLNDQAQENVRTTLSYLTDLGLFLVACWVYIFKDARLVIPILALMVYRQLGEALKEQLPKWINRKNS